MKRKKVEPVKPVTVYKGKVTVSMLNSMRHAMYSKMVEEPRKAVTGKAWQWLVDNDTKFRESVDILSDPRVKGMVYPTFNACIRRNEKGAYYYFDLPKPYASSGSGPVEVRSDKLAKNMAAIEKTRDRITTLFTQLRKSFLGRAKSAMFATFPELAEWHIEPPCETSSRNRHQLPVPVSLIAKIESSLCDLVKCIEKGGRNA